MTRLTFHRWTKRLAATVLAGCTAAGAVADEGVVRISGTSPTGLVRITDKPATGQRLVIRAQSGELATPQSLDILEDYQVLPDGTIVLPPGWKFVDEAPKMPAAPGVVSQKIVTQEEFQQMLTSPSKHPTPQSPIVAQPAGATLVAPDGTVVHAARAMPADIPADAAAETESAAPAAMPEQAVEKTERGGLLFRRQPGGLVGKLMRIRHTKSADGPEAVVPASAELPAAFPAKPEAAATSKPTGEIQPLSAEVPVEGEAVPQATVPTTQNLIPGATYIQMPDGSYVLDNGSYGATSYGYGADYGYCKPRSEMTKVEKDHYRQDKVDARRERICENGSLADRCGQKIHRSWLNYFIPRGCGGKGCPPVGCYNITYPVNPWHNDCRDGGIYAAEGYGGPVSVPLAPVVRHSYNYGWGVPSSRLTPVSHMAQRPSYYSYAHLPGHPYYVRAAANEAPNAEGTVTR